MVFSSERLSANLIKGGVKRVVLCSLHSELWDEVSETEDEKVHSTPINGVLEDLRSWYEADSRPGLQCRTSFCFIGGQLKRSHDEPCQVLHGWFDPWPGKQQLWSDHLSSQIYTRWAQEAWRKHLSVSSPFNSIQNLFFLLRFILFFSSEKHESTNALWAPYSQ